jgi:hypothetical protein
MDEKDRAMELYKLEYQKAAERYDNVYRSIWTIFSYLTAVAAGFLAFGADRIEPHALICIAAVPLLFWFWTTYMPLDRYGNEVINRLGQIECTLSRGFQVDLNHFKPKAEKELSIFKGLWQACKAKKGWGVWDQVHRARFAIGLIFIALHLVFIYELIGFRHSGQRLFLERPAASAPLAPTENVTVTGGSR